MLETSELCNSPVLDSESFGESIPSLICKQYNVLSGVKQTNKLQALYENSKTKGAINHAAQKQFKLFQTVNHARVIWDSKLKPKGILRGHLNIQSIISRGIKLSICYELKLDFLALSETGCLPVHQHAWLMFLVIVVTERIDHHEEEGSHDYIKDTFKCVEVKLDIAGLECWR